MTFTHYNPLTHEDERWEINYIIHPGQPEIMPEQPFISDELEILSVKDEAGRELIDSLPDEVSQEIELACWKDDEKLAKEYEDSF